MATRGTGRASRVLVVRPANFSFNEETASTNWFQERDTGFDRAILAERARAEFDCLVDALRLAGIDVHSFDDLTEGKSPDAVFPNNWISFHEDGTVVLYPMMAPTRREEVRRDIVDALDSSGVFGARRILDLTSHAAEGRYLEGTGSLVLDRIHGVAYASISPRTDRSLVDLWCQETDYRPVVFAAADRSGAPVYHTNVVMSVGAGLAVACLESVVDARERRAVEYSLLDTGHEILALSLSQMHAFAGNVLELCSASGETVVFASECARQALDPAQVAAFERHARLVSVPLEVIETHGGGSVRCMMAEIAAIQA